MKVKWVILSLKPNIPVLWWLNKNVNTHYWIKKHFSLITHYLLTSFHIRFWTGRNEPPFISKLFPTYSSLCNSVRPTCSSSGFSVNAHYKQHIIVFFLNKKNFRQKHFYHVRGAIKYGPKGVYHRHLWYYIGKYILTKAITVCVTMLLLALMFDFVSTNPNPSTCLLNNWHKTHSSHLDDISSPFRCSF